MKGNEEKQWGFCNKSNMNIGDSPAPKAFANTFNGLKQGKTKNSILLIVGQYLNLLA